MKSFMIDVCSSDSWVSVVLTRLFTEPKAEEVQTFGGAHTDETFALRWSNPIQKSQYRVRASIYTSSSAGASWEI